MFAVLKQVLAIFLFFITVAGSFIPCCETDECEAEQKLEGHSKEPEGNCSPFFSCTTCHYPLVPTPQLQFSFVIPQKKPLHINRQELLKFSGYTSPRFQPPRLS